MTIETRIHPAYSPDFRYKAIGRIKLADGSLSDPRTLFQFAAPHPHDLTDAGLIKIAKSLEFRTLAGYQNPGDEYVERIGHLPLPQQRYYGKR